MNIREKIKLLEKDDLSLSYFGNFDDHIIEKIIEISESFLEKKQLKEIKRKAVFLSAECFQNVARHSIGNPVGGELSEYHNAFFLRIQKDQCFIASANAVENQKKEYLEKRINELNQMKDEGLHELYKNVLENGKFSNKGGASLGLIEMARKTGNKINYFFEPKSQSCHLFFMMIKCKTKNSSNQKSENETIFEEIRKLYHQMISTNDFLLFKSDFRQDTILPVIKMIDDNIDDKRKSYSLKRKLFHASVEILQFISHFGLENKDGINGLFSFGKNNQDYILQSINECSAENQYRLSRGLDKLKGKSDEELKHRYRGKMITGDKNSPEMTFIDLARISKEWSYEFVNSEYQIPLFSYHLTI